MCWLRHSGCCRVARCVQYHSFVACHCHLQQCISNWDMLDFFASKYGSRIVVNLCTHIETTEVTVTLVDFMPKLERRRGS